MKLDENKPVKILRDGTWLPQGSRRTDHAAVLLLLPGILVHPVSLGVDDEPAPHAKCIELCRQLTVFGKDSPGDWELAKLPDWHHILDYSRREPAVDTTLYPGIKPRWHWTNTDAEWSRNAAGVASAAWGVYAYDGLVYSGDRDSHGVGLAVRRVGQ